MTKTNEKLTEIEKNMYYKLQYKMSDKKRAKERLKKHRLIKKNNK